MAANPPHARIGLYTAKPDADLDGVLAHARDELLPMTRAQPGFRRYTLVRTGPDTVASITAWDSREQAEAAAERLSGWVREVMGPSLASVENHIAEVVTITEASDAVPGYGRLTITDFPPGAQDEVIARAQTDLLPVMPQQPGFIRHVAFRVGPDRAITFLAFATQAELEAAEAATQSWREYVSSRSTGARRHVGPVVWAVRKD